MLVTPNWSVKPTAAIASIDAVTTPKPTEARNLSMCLTALVGLAKFAGALVRLQVGSGHGRDVAPHSIRNTVLGAAASGRARANPGRSHRHPEAGAVRSSLPCASVGRVVCPR